MINLHINLPAKIINMHIIRAKLKHVVSFHRILYKWLNLTLFCRNCLMQLLRIHHETPLFNYFSFVIKIKTFIRSPSKSSGFLNF